MTLGYIGFGCPLDPSDSINYFVPPDFAHYIDCPLEFGIDHPDQ